jgi:hypothetical protein
LRGFLKWALALADAAETSFDLLAFDFGALAGGDSCQRFRFRVLSLADADFLSQFLIL